MVKFLEKSFLSKMTISFYASHYYALGYPPAPPRAEEFVLPCQTGEDTIADSTEELLKNGLALSVVHLDENDTVTKSSVGSILIDEPSTLNCPWFIPPNEFAPATFAKVLAKSHGTLISVGTFRSLINFTNGSFDRAILFDIDQAVCGFNRMHLALIRKISKLASLSLAEQRAAYLSALQNSEIGKSQSLLLHLKKYKAAPAPFEYYWLSDAHWSRLASAICDNMITVQQGDLAGSIAIQSLALNLLRLDSRVSVIDISNVCDPFSKNSEKFKKILANLLRLPLTKDASLLFTRVENLHSDPTSLSGKLDMTWKYSSLPKKYFTPLLK
jgi:hypothetical protein